MERASAAWARAAAIATAGLAALVAVPAAVAILLFLAVGSTSLEGCEVELTPAEAGVSILPDGRVAVLPGACGPQVGSLPISSIRVIAADGTVVWQADAPNDGDPATPPPFDRVVVGEAPAGFTDVTPLAGPLDPAATYEAQLSVFPGAGPAGAPPSTTGDAYAVFGQRASFRPADVAPGTISYEGRSLTPAEFEQVPCDEDGGA